MGKRAEQLEKEAKIERYMSRVRRLGVEAAEQYGKRVKHEDHDKKAEDLAGGKADGMPDSAFPKDQIEMGMKVEREHIKDPKARREIAKDHLTEDKKYYTHLKEMEDKYVEKKAFWVGFEKKAGILR